MKPMIFDNISLHSLSRAFLTCSIEQLERGGVSSIEWRQQISNHPGNPAGVNSSRESD